MGFLMGPRSPAARLPVGALGARLGPRILGALQNRWKNLYNLDNDVAKGFTSYKSRNNPYNLGPITMVA